MLLSKYFFIDFDGSIWASDPFVLDINVASFPCFGNFSIYFPFYSFLIEEPVDSYLVETWCVTCLLNTWIVNVSDIRASVEKARLNGCKNLLALFGVIKALVFVSVVDLVGNEVMVFKVVDSELTELFVGETFVALSARIVQQQASQLDLEPSRGIRVPVKLDDDFSDSGSNDTCVLFTCQVHGLVFEFRELFIEFLQGQVINLCHCAVRVWLVSSF